MKQLEVTVNLPAGTLGITKDGCSYVPHDDRDTGWMMPLEKAEEVLGFAYRSVLLFTPRPLIAGGAEVAGSPAGAPLCGAVEGGGTRGPLAEASHPDPGAPPPPSSGEEMFIDVGKWIASPYCPFCTKPTCECWLSHAC